MDADSDEDSIKFPALLQFYQKVQSNSLDPKSTVELLNGYCMNKLNDWINRKNISLSIILIMIKNIWFFFLFYRFRHEIRGKLIDFEKWR